MSQKTQSAGVVVLGVAFEYFDLMLVNLMASSMIHHFIGSENTNVIKIYSFLAYAIAFLFRPLGAILFGSIGDLIGRKQALLASMFLMSLATLGIALIPSHSSIGVLSCLLFFFCRICQGLSVGGEYGTAMTYAYEMNPALRTFYGACVVSSSHLGGVFASLLASLFNKNFQVPFLIGGLLGLALFAFRSLLQEQAPVKRTTANDLFKKTLSQRGSILKSAIVSASMVFVFYGTLIYLNEWIHTQLHVERSDIFRYNTILLLFWVLIPPTLGYLIDRLEVKYTQVMLLGSVGICVMSPILCFSMLRGVYPLVLFSQMGLHLFLMLMSLGTPRFFGDLFSKSTRTTGISASYSLGASLTSAIAPLLCHAFVEGFASPFGLLVPLLIVGLGSACVFANCLLGKDGVSEYENERH